MAIKKKFNDNSRLLVQGVVERRKDSSGNVIEFAKWNVAEEEVNLGSINKPNIDIKKFKYEVPEDTPKNPFDMFFK